MAKASFNCNRETLDTFRRLVAQKYGRLYGVLETEFTLALNSRIAELKKELEQTELYAQLLKEKKVEAAA